MNQFTSSNKQSFKQNMSSSEPIIFTRSVSMESSEEIMDNSLLGIMAKPIKNLALKKFECKLHARKLTANAGSTRGEENIPSSILNIDILKMATELIIDALKDCASSLIIEEEFIHDIAVKMGNAILRPVDNEPVNFFIIPFTAANTSAGNLMAFGVGKLVGHDYNDLSRTFVINGYTSDMKVARKVIKTILRSLEFC